MTEFIESRPAEVLSVVVVPDRVEPMAEALERVKIES